MSLSYEVFDLDFPVGSTNKSAVLVTGETDAILVDAGFTRADGHRLVAAILDSGKRLTTVFVSHADPDFYFGLEAIVDAFPEATVVATPLVTEHIAASFDGKLKAWAALGANLPTRRPEISPLTVDFLELEGTRLELRGGSDTLPDRHYLWSGSDRAVLGGVLLFQQEHVWTADTATPEKRAAWVALLEEMAALDPNWWSPATVYPAPQTMPRRSTTPATTCSRSRRSSPLPQTARPQPLTSSRSIRIPGC